MSWLNEIRRGYRFECPECKTVIRFSGDGVTEAVRDEIPHKMTWCSVCNEDRQLRYAGFYTIDKIGLSHNVAKETFEKNGRKGIKIGNTYMSESKYRYLETGKIENSYTPGFQAHLEKEAEKNEYLLKTESNRNRANVTGISAESQKKLDKQIASLPDGEYTVSVERPKD